MIIHQIWMQGEPAIPDEYRRHATTLRAMNPEFEYKVWDERELERVCAGLGDRYLRAFRSAPHMHQRVDFGRYCVIYRYGGISIDMDVVPIKPIGPVVARVPEDRLGVTEMALTRTEASIMALRPMDYWLNNATLIAPRPGMPACRILVDKMADRLLNPGWRAYCPKSMSIMVTTGPAYFTRVFRDHVPDHMVHRLAADYFEPCVGYDDECGPTKDTVVDHRHDGTWHSMGTTVNVYHFLKRRPAVSLVCVVSLVVLVVCLARRGRPWSSGRR